MNILRRNKLPKTFITFAFMTMTLILLIGLVLSSAIMSRYKIGGNLYEEIILSDNLTADILPPPEYIVESYSVALEYINEFNADQREELYLQFQKLEKNYYMRHNYWEENLPNYGNLKKVFLEDSYYFANEFYDIFYNQVVPAVNAGNKDSIYEAQMALRKSYYQHRYFVDESIVLSKQWRQEIYNKSDKLADNNNLLMSLLILIILCLGLPIGLFIFRSEKALLEMAYYDGLTGLPNRKQFIDNLELLLMTPNADRFSVVFFDLDGFKGVNDTLGHAAGDTLLREVTTRLLKVKHPDDMLGRFSGDEFALLLTNSASEQDTLEYIGSFQKTVIELNMIKNKPISLSASFGVAFYPEDGTTSSDLLKHADKAMYRIKKAGGNGIQLFHAP